MTNVEKILKENKRRLGVIFAPFNPITGEGSIGERFELVIPDFPFEGGRQWLPVQMRDDPFVVQLADSGSVERFIVDKVGVPYNEGSLSLFLSQYNHVRNQYDFAYWAATLAYIKRKGGGSDCLFRLTYPQRKFVERLEQMRLAMIPIRLIMLKARQWGGSTTSQLYMAWMQLCLMVGLNSLIIGHQGTSSDEIKDMFDRMIAHYPVEMLHEINEAYSPNEPKMVGVGKSGNIHRVPQRNCKIKIGTAERPDSCRGGDYNLVHLSEVGLWKTTDGKKPEDIVRSACNGVLYKPYTMIVYESTANGVGNFFHREYVDARDLPRSQFKSMFVPWFDIPNNMIDFDDSVPDSPEYTHSAEAFAQWLYANRNSDVEPSNREESGRYLWYLWEIGATLQGINWYIVERAKFSSHGYMAAECPSDDTEAFVNSGASVFDKYKVESFRKACREPRYVGDVSADAETGEGSVSNLHFVQDSQGPLWVWSLPDAPDPRYFVRDRYLTVVDVGGRSAKADWSVILVIDRFGMMDGDKPVVVAQWYGHIDIDLLAWKAAQISAFYDHSLLVIESNTMETQDRFHDTEGDNSGYIIGQIKDVANLYMRARSEEDIREGRPQKYGYHTNRKTKQEVITNLIKVIREGLYIERDRRCLDEMLVYERKQNGAYGAVAGAHDDLVMTRAIGLHICYNHMDIPVIIDRAKFDARPSAQQAISEASII